MARVSRKRKNIPINETASHIWRTALYVRLSVEDNGKDADSIENQIAFLESYVSGCPDLSKIELFADNGFTGTNFQRPEFNRMMKAVQSGVIDCIVVKDLSRLGRNYIETSQFIEKICPFYGLRFIAVNDSFDTAAVTNAAQLSMALSNIVNDYYAKDISRKVTSALQTKMERGDYIGNYAPHGYCKDPENKNHLVIDPETAPVIRQIFLWRSEGVSYMGINRRLNKAGIPSPGQYRLEHGIQTNNNRKGRPVLWNKHMVTEILNNIVYIGHLAQKKGSQCLYAGIAYHITSESDWIIAENTHEPIISRDLFETVQKINRETAERIKKNSGKYAHLPREKNIFGKKFTCAGCGAVLKLHRSFSTKRDKAYFTFKCPTYAEHGAKGCSDIKIRKADLDAAVFSFIKAQMAVFIDMERTLQRLLAVKAGSFEQGHARSRRKALQQKLENKKSILSGLYVDYKEGLLSRQDYLFTRESIDADIHKIEGELAEQKSANSKTHDLLLGKMKWQDMIRKFQGAAGLSSEMVEAFVETVKLHQDGSLEIKLNYMDEFAALMDACEQIRKESA
ncbi:recombinase family protein [Flintibacter muris]|uniref:recombinase family protein n=1 Tax=Flintibacter muris TaxID=2941327 RepID=UPI00203FEDA2|nr:recombinase family protein [Flintibacter muris]